MMRSKQWPTHAKLCKVMAISKVPDVDKGNNRKKWRVTCGIEAHNMRVPSLRRPSHTTIHGLRMPRTSPHASPLFYPGFQLGTSAWMEGERIVASLQVYPHRSGGMCKCVSRKSVSVLETIWPEGASKPLGIARYRKVSVSAIIIIDCMVYYLDIVSIDNGR